MKAAVRPMLLACLLGVGCGRDAGVPGSDGSTQSPPAVGATQDSQSERTWVGLLPCSDCQGIDTRLVLRSDGGRRDYLLSETYLGGEGKNSFDRAGSWTEVSKKVDGRQVTLYILDPERATQSFSLQDDGALELLDSNDREPSQAVAYRLQRL